MQVTKEQFDQKIHERYHALTVKLPYAHYIKEGMKTIEVRSKPTSFRGTLVICSSQKPKIENMLEGAALCKVELYDCRKVSELTKEEWDRTCLSQDNFEKYKDHYAWMLRDLRPVIEIPVKGQLGIWTLYVGRYELNEYPDNLYDLDMMEKQGRSLEKRLQNLKVSAIAVTALFVVVIAAIISWLFFG